MAVLGIMGKSIRNKNRIMGKILGIFSSSLITTTPVSNQTYYDSKLFSRTFLLPYAESVQSQISTDDSPTREWVLVSSNELGSERKSEQKQRKTEHGMTVITK